MRSRPEVGRPAPDFTLPGWYDGHRDDFTLSDHRGQPMVLAFYPGDNTMVCTKQLCSYSERWDELTGNGATVWGISPQGIESHAAFAEQKNLAMPLLADVDGKVADAYGVGGRFLKRSIFVVDANGTLVWSHVAKLGLTFRPADEIIGVLERLQG